ncbi:MAG: DUF559 domain-containing protein, partial [Actinomycetota bacterium]|nr:DUF559 domain-containing protein [Actinomycetota bacterium]
SHTGRWRLIARGVYGDGPERPTAQDRAFAVVLRSGGIASGRLAGVLHGFDGVTFDGLDMTLRPGRSAYLPGVRRRLLEPGRVTVVSGIPCTDGLQTLVDLAASLDDLVWEQALEFGFRKQLLVIGQLEELLPELGRGRTPGTRRIRRVLLLRPAGAPATESLLETLMVQLIRTLPNLGEPVRQLEIYDEYGNFVARVDLAWPELGLFIELDGQQHAGQPLYDSSRETAIVAVTGWLCGRFTWTEVRRFPTTTGRRLSNVAEQARRRPQVAPQTSFDAR